MERRTVATVVAVAVVAIVGTVPVATATTVSTSEPTTESSERATRVFPGPVTNHADPHTGANVPATRNESATDERPDPARDVLGWEAGYWHDEAIDVDQSDGISETELDALVARSMARVEYIRRLEFEEQVPVEVVPRSALSGGFAGASPPADTVAWRNQVWEALFVDGEDSNVLDAFRNLTSGAVLGFYSPQRDRIVVVTESAEQPVVDNVTLVHELVHALQDQHFDLRDDRFDPRLHDARLAANGLVEGGAGYVEARYARRCRAGTWNCTASAPDPGDVDVNRGIHAAVYQPYSDGPPFVASVVARGGWTAVNELYEDPPDASAAIIHPEQATARSREAAQSRELRFQSRSRNGWQTFIGEGIDGTQTVGEATIYAMFWYQGDRFDIDAIRWRTFDQPDRGTLDTYNYTSAASAGWVDDQLVPYHRGDDLGYLWRTAWATERDARQFRAAYLRVLRGHDADQRGPNTWVVPDGPFADAFRVHRDGRTVTVVNGPDVTALGQIRPGLNSTASGANDSVTAP